MQEKERETNLRARSTERLAKEKQSMYSYITDLLKGLLQGKRVSVEIEKEREIKRKKEVKYRLFSNVFTDGDEIKAFG